jgi:hypothetical protein
MSDGQRCEAEVADQRDDQEFARMDRRRSDIRPSMRDIVIGYGIMITALATVLVVLMLADTMREILWAVMQVK